MLISERVVATDLLALATHPTQVIPVKTEAPRLVVWACHVCEMANLGGYSPGARKDGWAGYFTESR